MPLARLVASCLFQIRSGTWLALALLLLAAMTLAAWLAASSLGWLWNQGKTMAESVPETVRAIAAQVDRVVPGAHEVLGGMLPALGPEAPSRDVSGDDIGPVARFPGLTRTHWKRSGNTIEMRLEGRADHLAVLDHYARGFVAKGYLQTIVSASPEGETHEYRKGTDEVEFELARLPADRVRITLIAVPPAPTSGKTQP